jgi:hypothetical protein
VSRDFPQQFEQKRCVQRTCFRCKPSGSNDEYLELIEVVGAELALKKALRALEQTFKGKLHMPKLAEIRKAVATPDNARVYLTRMQLDRPQSSKERLLQRALVYALASVNAI